MNRIEYMKLGACAMCVYSTKDLDDDLKCHWDDEWKDCRDIKQCGHFDKIKE